MKQDRSTTKPEYRLWRYGRRHVTIHTYFNVLGERYRKTINGKNVTYFSQWDGQSWQKLHWSKGNRIQKLVNEGYGKRNKRQSK